MQTVINWTRYDGTPETLPGEFDELVVVQGGVILRSPCWLIKDSMRWWERGLCLMDVEVGDLWAPWPVAPEVE